MDKHKSAKVRRSGFTTNRYLRLVCICRTKLKPNSLSEKIQPGLILNYLFTRNLALFYS
jgi:hypothetical protein